MRLLLLMERAEKILQDNLSLGRATPKQVKKKYTPRDVQIVHVHLLREKAEEYTDKWGTQSLVWNDFHKFASSLEVWVEEATGALREGSTLKNMTKLTKDFRRNFPNISTDLVQKMSDRTAAVTKWIPKEQAAFDKQLRVEGLTKLYYERFPECGKTASPLTTRLEREVNRAEEWVERLHAGMEFKADADYFKNLLKETTGPNPVLVESKDISMAEHFIQRYCLCQCRWEDGVFMIGCDSCEDWYHDKCVNLTEDKAKSLKSYKCPRCCQAANEDYAYGIIEGFHTPKKESVPPTPEKKEKKPKKEKKEKKPKKEKEKEVPKEKEKPKKKTHMSMVDAAKDSGAGEEGQPRTAALFTTLLYDNLHDKISAENSNVLWHLLNAYMNRPLNARLQEEILEAVKLVCGEQVLSEALAIVNKTYLAQTHGDISGKGHKSKDSKKNKKRNR